MNEQDLSDMRAAAHRLIDRMSETVLRVAFQFLKSLVN